MEKYFVARKKRRNGKEEGTEMKNGKKKKNMRTCGFYMRIYIQKTAW